VRWPENMAMSGSGLCEGLHHIFLTFWVLLGQAKSTIKKAKICRSAPGENQAMINKNL